MIAKRVQQKLVATVKLLRAQRKALTERFSPLSAAIINSCKRDKREIVWSTEAKAAFQQCKTDLSNTTLLTYLFESAEIRLITDA